MSLAYQTSSYQTSNILDNLYTDGIFTYIFTTTLTSMSYQFQSIITYCNTQIPLWKPTYNNPSNRIAFNSDSMFELIFYKNLILIIPLYLATGINNLFENNILYLKNYLNCLCIADDNMNNSITTLIDYKIIFYSPTANLSSNLPINLFKTKKTILQTDLHIDLFQSYPISLSTLLSIPPRITTTSTMPSTMTNSFIGASTGAIAGSSAGSSASLTPMNITMDNSNTLFGIKY